VRTYSPETRARLLATATAALTDATFESVRMEDIATAAEVGKPTIYRYFPTKLDLLRGILEDAGRDDVTATRGAELIVRGCAGRVGAHVHAAVAFFAGRPHLRRLIDRGASEWGRESPWSETESQAAGGLRGLLAEGIVRGEFGIAADDLEVVSWALAVTPRTLAGLPMTETPAESVSNWLVATLARPVAPRQAA
jgi:AcrR family transcriptional regulator